MYIIAIAWIYVVLMMAVTEHSIVAGVMTVVFYGLAPLALFLWLFGTPARRRARMARPQPGEDGPADDSVTVGKAVDEVVDQQNAAHAERNQ